MQVVILGGGTVGSAIADLLTANRHTVTIVERDANLVELLDEQHQGAVCHGSASHSATLFAAGVSGADLCLAVTGDDETNLVAASMAKSMGARRVAARTYSQIFRDRSTFDYHDHFHIDRILSIENFAALELSRRIRSEGEMFIEHLAGGTIEMQEVLITRPTALTGKLLSQLSLPQEVRVAAIKRDGPRRIAAANDTLEVGDRVILIGLSADIEQVKTSLRVPSFKKKKVVIAGGGETGALLATILETRHCHVRIMERDRTRCDELNAMKIHATILCCDARQRGNLDEERVGEADAFIACTGKDEDNILACVEAEAVGVPLRVAIVDRPDYANVLKKLGIQEAVSSRAVLAEHVLSLMNTGAVVVRHSQMLGDGIDVVELEVQPGSPITRDVLMNTRLPSPTVLAGVVSGSEAWIPHAQSKFRDKETVIAITTATNVVELAKVFAAPPKS